MISITFPESMSVKSEKASNMASVAKIDKPVRAQLTFFRSRCLYDKIIGIIARVGRSLES